MGGSPGSGVLASQPFEPPGGSAVDLHHPSLAFTVDHEVHPKFEQGGPAGMFPDHLGDGDGEAAREGVVVGAERVSSGAQFGTAGGIHHRVGAGAAQDGGCGDPVTQRGDPLGEDARRPTRPSRGCGDCKLQECGFGWAEPGHLCGQGFPGEHGANTCAERAKSRFEKTRAPVRETVCETVGFLFHGRQPRDPRRIKVLLASPFVATEFDNFRRIADRHPRRCQLAVGGPPGVGLGLARKSVVGGINGDLRRLPFAIDYLHTGHLPTINTLPKDQPDVQAAQSLAQIPEAAFFRRERLFGTTGDQYTDGDHGGSTGAVSHTERVARAGGPIVAGGSPALAMRNSSCTALKALHPLPKEVPEDTMAAPQENVVDEGMYGDHQMLAELEAYRERALNLEQQHFELRTLLQACKGFSENFKVEELLHSFMEVCRERCDAACSAVLLEDDLDPETRQFRVRAFWGLPERYVAEDGVEEELFMFRVPADSGLFWHVLRQGEVVGVRNMDNSVRFPTAWRRWRLDVLRSDVWVPLMREGRVIGILCLGTRTDGTRIPEADHLFLKEIANIGAASINFTVQYEKNKQILENIRTLYDVNQQLANVNDFKTLTIETLSTAVDAMKAQKANLMLLNEDQQLLEIKVVWGDIPKAVREGINDGRIKTKALGLGEGVAGQAAQTRRTVRINHRTKIEQFGQQPVHCIMSVPLVYGGRLLGVMTMTNKVEDNRRLDPVGRFTEQDEQLAQGLADQAAHNLHKARLYDASITDRLTGLKNNRHYQDSLGELIQTHADGGPGFTLAVLDIDHFKRFNDTWGHKAGDHVLAGVARCIQEACRPGTKDKAFRYGGEEFCMLLPSTDAEGAKVVLEGLRMAVEGARFEVDGHTLNVTISSGICDCNVGSGEGPSLFESADLALYRAKEAGRNHVAIYRGEQIEVVPRTSAPRPAAKPEGT
jgi:diguanylate cyclase (GGDEF)-like protein